MERAQAVAGWPPLAPWIPRLEALGTWALGAAIVGYVLLVIMLLMGLFGELKNWGAVDHDDNHTPQTCPWQREQQPSAAAEAQPLHS